MNFQLEDIYAETEKLSEVFKSFEYSQLPTRYFTPRFDQTFFTPGRRVYMDVDAEHFYKYIMIKGLLNRLDYAASAEISVEYQNDFLESSMDKLLEGWKKEKLSSGWNPLQEYMLQHREENVIVIAQTGMGKTEAGLLWLGNHKGFFTLPLKSAINAIYNRIKEEVIGGKLTDKVGLLHSDTLKIYSENEEVFQDEEHEDKKSDSQLQYYYTSTKQLSLPLTICTLDQIFDFVYFYKGFELKLATLSYSKLIIDEIQMYSSDLVAYLISGLYFITKLGGKYAILTATLPGIILDFMKEKGLNPPPPAVFTNDMIRHSFKLMKVPIDSTASITQMAEAFTGNKILIICNTIKRAKSVYHKLKRELESLGKSGIYLLHSGFIRSDRSEKESNITVAGKKDSTVCEIWVSTQIVEASLDIDFDMLFTELSDLNGLFQRMGRCYRHRLLDVDYNCFVFTEKCSGIGIKSVIEPEIHELSRESLNFEGKISEERKVKMIESLYSTEKLSKTNYYTKIEKALSYLKDLTEYVYSKQDVTKRFRDINQVSAIPLSVYQLHKEEIQKNIETLRDAKANLNEKVKAREVIRDFMVPVHSRLAEKTMHCNIKIDKNFEIIVIDAAYSSEAGIDFDKTKNKEFQDVENRMF